MPTVIMEKQTNEANLQKKKEERVERIVNYSKQRSEEVKERVLEALQTLIDSGENITFYKVAQLSGASKSFLYTNKEVHDAIKKHVSQEPLKGDDAENNRIKRLQRINHQQRTEIQRLTEKKEELNEKVFSLQRENEKLKKENEKIKQSLPSDAKNKPKRKRKKTADTKQES